MKSKFLNSFLGILMYLVAGFFLWGNHYYALPLFLVLVSITSYGLNYKKQPDEVKKNLFWIGLPILLLLLISSVFVPESFLITITYVVFTALALIGIYFIIKDSSKVKKALYGLGIALLPIIVLIFCGFLSENHDIGTEFTNLKNFFVAISK